MGTAGVQALKVTVENALPADISGRVDHTALDRFGRVLLAFGVVGHKLALGALPALGHADGFVEALDVDPQKHQLLDSAGLRFEDRVEANSELRSFDEVVYTEILVEEEARLALSVADESVLWACLNNFYFNIGVVAIGDLLFCLTVRAQAFEHVDFAVEDCRNDLHLSSCDQGVGKRYFQHRPFEPSRTQLCSHS